MCVCVVCVYLWIFPCGHEVSLKSPPLLLWNACMYAGPCSLAFSHDMPVSLTRGNDTTPDSSPIASAQSYLGHIQMSGNQMLVPVPDV